LLLQKNLDLAHAVDMIEPSVHSVFMHVALHGYSIMIGIAWSGSSGSSTLLERKIKGPDRRRGDQEEDKDKGVKSTHGT
jgi:hypothetical protein